MIKVYNYPMKVYLLADIRDQINEQMFVPIVTAAADCCKNQVNFKVKSTRCGSLLNHKFVGRGGKHDDVKLLLLY